MCWRLVDGLDVWALESKDGGTNGEMRTGDGAAESYSDCHY